MTRIGRHDEGYADLLAQAVSAALAASGSSSVDSVCLSSFAPRELCGITDTAALVRAALRACGMNDAPVHGPFRTGGEALHTAIERCGATDGDVLVVGCEKMMHLD